MRYFHIPLGFQLPDAIDRILLDVSYKIYLTTGMAFTPEVIVVATVSALVGLACCAIRS